MPSIVQAITFGGFLAGFIFYLCIGNYHRAKRAMDRQKQRRIELEEEKRALAYSPSVAGGSIVGDGSTTRRRIIGVGNHHDTYDSPRSGFSGTSSMYTDEKGGLTVGVGGVTVEGSRSHMLLGGDHGLGASQFAVSQTQQRPPSHKTIDLLDYNDNSVAEQFRTVQKKTSQGEMSV